MRRFNGVEKTIFALILATVCIGIIVPLMFFLANSFSNATEIYEYPKSPLISFKVTVKVEYLEENDEYAVFFKAKDGTYMNAIISGSGLVLSNYFEQYFSVYQSPDELLEDFSTTKTDGSTEFTYNKNMFHNVKTFFLITSNAERALKNSMLVVVYTIIISLTLGSMCGYAMARYHFFAKDQINVFLLVVRMFPMVGISIPLAVILIRINLFNTMFGLAILYSLPNIALTSWVTSSVFVGIKRELEEASLIFGATGFKTFMKITLPLALPAMAASSMYAFLTAWNDTIAALILTNNNPTLALTVYQAVGDNTSNLQYVAAGSLILILPALVFTFMVRKYVNKMWGSVSL